MNFPQLAKLVQTKLIRGSLLVAAVYLAAAKLGLTTAFTAEQVTLVWPPTGLSLGILMLLGPDLWPGLLLGAFVANLTAHQPVALARRVGSAVHYPREYLVFPFLIWAAIRFGIAGAAFANLLTATIAIWGTGRGFGPYAAGQGDERLMLLQIFLSVVSSSGLLLGA